MIDDLTKLTVNLTKRSVIAMEDAAGRTGDSRTDTVNRALQVYQHLLWLTKERNRFLEVDNLVPDGRTYRIRVVRRRWWHSFLVTNRGGEAVTGWIEPTPNQLADARRLLAGRDNPAEVALRQIGIHLDRVRRGDFDSDDWRRLLAFYRAWEEL